MHFLVDSLELLVLEQILRVKFFVLLGEARIFLAQLLYLDEALRRCWVHDQLFSETYRLPASFPSEDRRGFRFPRDCYRKECIVVVASSRIVSSPPRTSTSVP